MESAAVRNPISIFGQNFRSCILNFKAFKLRRQCPSADRLFDQISTHICTYRAEKSAIANLANKKFFETRIALKATSKKAPKIQYYGYYDSSHLLGKYSEFIGALTLFFAQGLVVLFAPLMYANPIFITIFIALIYCTYIKYTIDTSNYYKNLLGNTAFLLAEMFILLSAPLLCTNPVIAAIFICLLFSMHIKYTNDILSYYNDLPKNIKKCIERKCHMLFGPDFADSFPYLSGLAFSQSR